MLQQNLLAQPGVFQSFLENHPDGICIVDMDGFFIHVNAAALKMFGYTREEILLISLDQLLNGTDVPGRTLPGIPEPEANWPFRTKTVPSYMSD